MSEKENRSRARDVVVVKLEKIAESTSVVILPIPSMCND